MNNTVLAGHKAAVVASWSLSVALAAHGTSLAEWLSARAGARHARVGAFTRLRGGAVRENWALDITFEGGPLAGRRRLVLRTEAPARLAESRSLGQEFAILRAVHRAGVRAPAPRWLADNNEIIGRPFFIMDRGLGNAQDRQVVGAAQTVGWGAAVAERLGAELARVHAIDPTADGLEFLGPPSVTPALDIVSRCRAFLDGWADPHPALEWGLRWLEVNAPATDTPVLAHRDFRTGNYMVADGRLSAILDWEFAGWSDPLEDVGWFCAKCWRFGAAAKEAGGIAPRKPFYRGYEYASGRKLDPDLVHYWEVMAHARWAVIALQQAQRHLNGGERSLELALLGRRPAELEFEILRMIGVIGQGRHA